MARFASVGVCATVVMVVACTIAPEDIGQSAAALSMGAIGTVANFENEMSADWSPANLALRETLVIGFNDKTNGENVFGWAWSDDNAATWHRCNADSILSCNSFGSVDPPDTPIYHWQSDPTVLTDRNGRAVYVTLADDGTYSVGARRVAAVVSHDSGKNFDGATATFINDDSCSDGKQDQPGAAFDFTTNPPTLWIVWRHAGSYIYGVCLRRFILDQFDHLQPLDAAQVVQVSPGFVGWGIGGVRVQAGDGAVTVVYSDSDALPRCPTTGSDGLSIKASSSLDMGHTWSQTLLVSGNFSPCVLSQQVDMGANARNFDYVRAPDGTNYVIVQDTQSTLRLFMDRDGASAEPMANTPWREWCPGTFTGGPGSPTMNWTAPMTSCATPFWTHPQGKSLAWPTIAADDRGRVGVWFYEADSTDTTFHVHFRGNVGPRSPLSTTWVDASPASGDMTPTFLGTRSLGDYEGMAVRWGLRQPQCGSTGTFFPVWTFADTPTSNCQAQTREISFP